MPVNGRPRALVPALSDPVDSDREQPSSTSAGPAVIELLSNCDAHIDFSDYSIPILIICTAAFIVGLLFCLFGYRLFKATLFLTGFLFGVVVVYLICDKESLLPELGNAGVSILAGVLFGLVTMLVDYVGFFMTGFLGGQLIGALVMTALRLTIHPASVWLTIGVLFLSGVVVAQLTLAFQRVFTVLCTAAVGAAMISIALDYTVNRFAIVEWLWTDALGTKVAQPADTRRIDERLLRMCWYGWALVALWPLLSFVGVIVQFYCTAIGFSHTEGFLPYTSRKKYEERRASAQRLNEIGASDLPPHASSSQQHRSHCSSIVSSPDRSTDAKRKRQQQKKKSDNHQHGTNVLSPADSPVVSPSTSYPKKSFISLYRLRNKGDIICQSHMESLQRSASRSGICGDQAQTTLTSVNSTQLTDISELAQTPAVVGQQRS